MARPAHRPSTPEPADAAAVPGPTPGGDGRPAAEALPGLVLFFDGECAFCDRSVRRILDHPGPAAERFHFAPLQGTTAAAVRQRRDAFPDDIDTVVLLERGAAGEVLHLRSAAALRVAELLDLGPRPLRALLAALPRPLLDLAYRAFAASRYRIFGRLDACALPSPDERARFLP